MNDSAAPLGARSWLAKAPVTPAIFAAGALVSGLAFAGLRAVETSQGEVAHERTLLAQSSELQSEVQRQVRGVDAIRLRIEEGEAASPVAMDRFLAAIGFGDTALVYAEQVSDRAELEALTEREATNADLLEAYNPPEGSHFVVTRSNGVDPVSNGVEPASNGVGLAPLGATFVGGGEFDRALLEAATLHESTVLVDPVLVDPVLEGPESVDTIVIAGPVKITDSEPAESPPANASGLDGLSGVVLARMTPAELLANLASVNSSDSALGLSVDGVSLDAGDGATRGQAVGEPVTFTVGDSNWSIQGYSNGLTIDRRSSWLVLLSGLAITGLAVTFAQTMRRHSLTLGRLERSQHDARHDVLTGLLNRAGLTDELARVLGDRRGSDLIGVLFLDLDRLKVVNDSIGHSAGDEVLKAVGERLDEIVRDGDIVGRFGGDEFVIVTGGVPAVSDVTGLADRVLDVLKEPAILSDESSQLISASIGIAYVAKGDASAEDLLRDADLAMYRAKEGGGSRYAIFDEDMRSEAVARLEVERELRKAIRHGQLVVHYQPIVDITDGSVGRLEALVRWQHPVRGMIPPGAFLSVAAESGLIVDLGEHVLREACRQVASWSAIVGREIMVSVNVAERQLIDAGLVDTVRRVLAETGVKPSQLELEITEELIVDRLDHRLTVLRELVDMGIKLAIDDFGTSRASLGQLKKLDMVSTLKIDRAFVIDVANDVVDRKIITAIVALAESVGMEVVAEGVEDVEQVAVLRQLGIDHIQGFYFQRPGPSEKMVTILNKTFEVPEAANATV